MWAGVLVCAVTFSVVACNVTQDADADFAKSSLYTASHADNAWIPDKDKDLHFPEGSAIGYMIGRGLTSSPLNNKTMWFLPDRPEGLIEIINRHPMNVYDDDDLKTLKEGVPVFVRTWEDKWYKIFDPPSEFRKYLVEELSDYTDQYIPMLKLGRDDFKPAIVEFYEKRWYVPQDVERLKKKKH